MRAVVTGANRGIGLELVRQLAAQGASVEATAREPARAGELRAIADATPDGRVRVHACDVRDDASVRALGGGRRARGAGGRAGGERGAGAGRGGRAATPPAAPAGAAGAAPPPRRGRGGGGGGRGGGRGGGGGGGGGEGGRGCWGCLF